MQRSSVRKKLRGNRMIKKTLTLILMCMIMCLSDFMMLRSCAAKKSYRREVDTKGFIASDVRSVSSKNKEKMKDKRSTKSLPDRDNSEVRRAKRAIVPVRKVSISSIAFKSIGVLKSSLQSSADAALSSTSRVQRRFKSYFSSDFEVLLLRMTAPDDHRLADDDLERFIATIETFVRNMDVTSQSNPYRVTLRKIWSKAAETDGKTVLKAQFLLHTLLRGTTPEDSLIFKTLLKKMLREKCNKTKSKYFDIAKISTVSQETKHLKDFITRYSIYIFQRAKTFTSCFEEVKLIGDGMRTEDICAQLMKAVKVLNSALNCGIKVKKEGEEEEEEEECDIVLACCEIVANDVRDLFTLFHTKLLWILHEDKCGDLFEGWNVAEVRAILSHLKTFYSNRFEDIEDLLLSTAERLKHQCQIVLPVSLPSPASFEDIIPGDGGDSGMRGRSFPSITHLDSSSSGAGSAESVNDDNIDDDDDDYDREVSSSSSAIYDTDDI